MLPEDFQLWSPDNCLKHPCQCNLFHPDMDDVMALLRSQELAASADVGGEAASSEKDLAVIAPRGFKKTPASNTGSNSQNQSTTQWEPFQSGFEPYVDYLQGTGYCLYSDLQSLVKWYSDNAIDEIFHKAYTYKYVGDTSYLHSYQSLLQLHIQYVPLNQVTDIRVIADINAGLDIQDSFPLETPVKFHITIPGKPLAALGFRNALQFMRLLSEVYNFRCSRIDPKVRCHDKIIDFDTLELIVESKDFTPVMQHHFHKSSTVAHDDIEGRTIALGTPSSDKRISFYYALPVHGVDALDIEVRYRNSRALQAFHQIIGTSEDNLNYGQSAEVIHKLVAGSVDFIYKQEGQKNLDRCLRYEFWGKFIDAAGGAIRVSKPKNQFSGVKQIQWIETKCYKALAVAREMLGSVRFHKWMHDMCDRGKAAFTAEHDAYIRLYKSSRIFDNRFAVNNS